MTFVSGQDILMSGYEFETCYIKGVPANIIDTSTVAIVQKVSGTTLWLEILDSMMSDATRRISLVSDRHKDCKFLTHEKGFLICKTLPDIANKITERSVVLVNMINIGRIYKRICHWIFLFCLEISFLNFRIPKTVSKKCKSIKADYCYNMKSENNPKWASNIRNTKSGYPNAWNRWTNEEQILLLSLYTNGISVKQMSLELERTSGSIRSRLKKLIVIKEGNL
eukprot:TRINITY_DN11591_c0_g1_i1.p1 TRINITY_DN11591_c0_g1~~TRINITY_DN11591_c0_g1_i1.p1  ORF type:complete len:224 (+),score=28.87 TRINITY_DN11591_c0_g1_i1:33-704(+)